ncbi:MAG: Spermidine/spermine N(1)-acetyltransferase [Saprospiraceae bacterium]|nr:Spermidine/spermine N(1)-acetyltransferase [Saprospiraceae bacterium]
MTIKKVRLADAEILRALAERTFRDAWQDENEPEAFEQYCREHFSTEAAKTELAAPDTEFYFAEINGEPVAYLKLNRNKHPDKLPDDTEPTGGYSGNALQLERIYVLQSAQSQGLGAELLRFTEQRARETGATWIWLSVWQKSPRTIKFYERNGFSIFGVETFWVGDDPQPDWLMRKRIGGDQC